MLKNTVDFKNPKRDMLYLMGLESNLDKILGENLIRELEKARKN